MSSKMFKWGGFIAGAVLLVFGLGALWVGWGGYNTVHNNLKAEGIVGSPDMTPAGIAKEAKSAGLPATISLPTCSVAGQTVDNGSKARCFAQYMRIHTLEATGGQVYASMGRYLDAAGKPTNDQAAAAKDASGQPVANAARDIWVTETALTTALNTSYMAERLAIFGLVVGAAFVFTGVGFIVISAGLLNRKKEEDEVADEPSPAPAPGSTPVAI
jgi:hypothetical protein